MTARSAQVGRWIPSPNFHRPARRRTALIVLHSLESPLTQGYTLSIALNWFGKKASQVSSHYITGPLFNVGCVDEADAAWTCGPVGNPITINIEQPGYARFNRAQWLTPTGRAMIRNTAELIADVSRRNGGPRAPRRASRAQIRAYAAGQAIPGGVAWCTHNDVSRYLGGTSHTDPGVNYPYDVLQADMNPAVPPPPLPKDKPVTEAEMDRLIVKLTPVIAAQAKAAVEDALTGGVRVEWDDSRLRPTAEKDGSIVSALGRIGTYASNASGGVDQLARISGVEPEDRGKKTDKAKA